MGLCLGSEEGEPSLGSLFGVWGGGVFTWVFVWGLKRGSLHLGLCLGSGEGESSLGSLFGV